MAAAVISQLFTHPIKGARGVPLERAVCTRTGLRYDRQFMVVREDTGKFISQREVSKLALVVPQLPDGAMDVEEPGPSAVMTVSAPDMASPLLLPLAVPADPTARLRSVTVWEWKGQAVDMGEEAAAWFTKVLGLPCRLVRYLGTAYEDGVPPPASNSGASTPKSVLVRSTSQEFAPGGETSLSDGFPLLLASESSLADLNSRLAASGSPLAPLPIIRFRPNIVVSGLEAWAEDLYRTLKISDASGSGQTPIELTSVKPCSRCKVPTIDPYTGVPSEGEPLDILATFRKGSDLGWSVKSWKHAVHFCWNLAPEETAVGRVIAIGDRVEFSGAQKAF